jgi:hypothetical protein
MERLRIFGVVAILVSLAFGLAFNLPPLTSLQRSETPQAAKLTALEIKQISEQLEATSYDYPDSWETETLVRRVSLGEAEGIVVQGKKLLCGGTGNCQTWVFRHLNNRWQVMFEGQAPIASGFGFERQTNNGIRNFVIVAHISAASAGYVEYKFDGGFYRASQCYTLSQPDSDKKKPERKNIACK